MSKGTLQRPESNKKKIIIIAVSVFICLSASSGLYYVFHKAAGASERSERQSGQEIMKYQVDTYFSLPDEKQKTAYLDRIIDRMQEQQDNFEQLRRQMSKGNVNEPNRPQQSSFGGGRNFSPADMRAMRERQTPQHRARQIWFMQALQKRMQQREINPPGPGSGR